MWWTAACQAPLSMGFSRQEYWSGLPFPSLGDHLNPGIEPRYPTWQADSSWSEPLGKHIPIQYLFVYLQFIFPTSTKFLNWQQFTCFAHDWVPSIWSLVSGPQQIVVEKIEWVDLPPHLRALSSFSRLAAAFLSFALRWIRLHGVHTHLSGIYGNFTSSRSPAFVFRWQFGTVFANSASRDPQCKALGCNRGSIYHAGPPSPASLIRQSGYFRNKKWNTWHYVRIFTWAPMLGTKS